MGSQAHKYVFVYPSPLPLPCLSCPSEAERAEVLHTPPLDFGCTVLVLGLSGAGKTATIHSLLGRPQPVGYRETNKVRVRVQGWLGESALAKALLF